MAKFWFWIAGLALCFYSCSPDTFELSEAEEIEIVSKIITRTVDFEEGDTVRLGLSFNAVEMADSSFVEQIQILGNVEEIGKAMGIVIDTSKPATKESWLGYIAFSELFIHANRKSISFQVNHYCGGECGSATKYTFEKKGNSWKLLSEDLLWVA
ncbi:MAG: hypothetical protein EP332_05605 [Bacteroidetes bacterium]|nr:MAG: hypothetical protein EP332_05605 [Bacteroidota bacterium]